MRNGRVKISIMETHKKIKLAIGAVLIFGLFSVLVGLIISLWFAVPVGRGDFEPHIDFSALKHSSILFLGTLLISFGLAKRWIVGYWLAIISALLFIIYKILAITYYIKIFLPYMDVSFMAKDMTLFAVESAIKILLASVVLILLLSRSVRSEFGRQ